MRYFQKFIKGFTDDVCPESNGGTFTLEKVKIEVGQICLEGKALLKTMSTKRSLRSMTPIESFRKNLIKI